jgi:cytochrome c-type biogenesis protein
MQVIPFFLAFIVGSGIAAGSAARSALVIHAIKPAVVAFAGFTFVFVAMGVTSGEVSKFLFHNAALFTQLGAVAIALAGLQVGGWLTVSEENTSVATTVQLGLAAPFGAGIGFAYKPCVSPELTAIFKIAGNLDTAGSGAILLGWYAAGIGTLITVAGVIGVVSIDAFAKSTVKNNIRTGCAVIVVTLAVIIMTDNMTVYKSFLVGRFAPKIDTATLPQDQPVIDAPVKGNP